MSTIATIAAIIAAATDEGTWVNDPIEAVVRNARTGQGKKPSKADLYDPGNVGKKITVSWFSGDLLQFEGGVIRISGKGTKAKIYKGETELEIGKNAKVELLGAAPAGAAPAPAAASHAAPAGRPPESPEAGAARFHVEMKRIALLRVHAHQYALDVAERIRIDPHDDAELFQSIETSMFMTAKDRGLLERAPAPRELDSAGRPVPFVKPQPAHDPEAEKKAQEERERAAAIAAEEAARKAADEARRKADDELVPF